MTNDMTIIVAVTAYKVTCVGVGFLCCFLGYRLFTLGIVKSAGSLDASVSGSKLSLKSAAPGTFFAVLGAVIVLFTVWRGISFEDGKGFSNPPGSAETRAPKEAVLP
jgi:hypothetical protein